MVYEDSDSEDDYGFLGSVEGHELNDSQGGNLDSVETKPWITNVKVDGISVTFKVDSGADVTVISEKEFERFSGKKSTKILCGPGKSQFDVIGKFQCTLETKQCCG